MFEDSLLESGGRSSAIARPGPWAPLASFALQTAALGLLLLIPLLCSQGLQNLRFARWIAPPVMYSPAPRVQAEAAQPSSVHSAYQNGVLILPDRVPPRIAIVRDDPAPPGFTGIAMAEASTLPIGLPDGIPGGVARPAVPAGPPPTAAPRLIHVSSGVTAGMLTHTVRPDYPIMAKQARISGNVVLQAVIGKDGSIQNLRVVSGHPMLVESAIAAVRQWKYKPYLLNNEPVEVDTQVTVSFILAGS